jgi:hypothetical protein
MPPPKLPPTDSADGHSNNEKAPDGSRPGLRVLREGYCFTWKNC